MAIKVYRIKVEEVVDRGAIQLIQGTTHLQTVNPSHSNERGVFIAQPKPPA
jgi:hypothetical protein